MRRNGLMGMVAGMLACTAAAAPARAQQVSEVRLQELLKQAAATVAIGGGRTQQMQASPGDTRTVVPMTLDEAVKLALDRNLDIAVQRLNPEINDLGVAKIRVVYHPSLTSTSSAHRRQRPRPPRPSRAARRAATRSSRGSPRSTAASRRAFRGAAARSTSP